MVMKGPYASRHAEFACEIAEAAMDKGHKVDMMFYMDGVHVPKKGLDPRSVPNINEALARVIKKGADTRSCVRAAMERGYVKEAVPNESGTFPSDQYLEGITVTSGESFGTFVKESDKVIALNV